MTAAAGPMVASALDEPTRSGVEAGSTVELELRFSGRLVAVTAGVLILINAASDRSGPFDVPDLHSPIRPGVDHPFTPQLVGADQPAGDPINSRAAIHGKELTFHMQLTWFSGRAHCRARRSTRQGDSEAGCRNADAFDALAPHPSSP